MRPGLLEIVAIIIVAILILVVTRITRARHNTTNNKSKTSTEIDAIPIARQPRKVRQRLRATGIILIITGIISLLAGISLFRWVYWSYLWSFIAISIGFTMILISRSNKREKE